MQNNLEGKKILVAILNWGLGHATRSIPLVQKLLAKGCQVELAGDGESLQYISEVFPTLKTHQLPSYNIEYPSGWGGAWKTVFKAPEIIRAIREENVLIKTIVESNRIDAIISDNRYGVYHTEIPSIFLGHQLRVLPPKGLMWAAPLVLKWHKKFLKNFDEIWVPDYPGEKNLSGILSHQIDISIPIRYIGPLSRFENNTIDSSINLSTNKVLALLSGPEPQRSNFEKILLDQLKKLNISAVVVRGKVVEEKNYITGTVEVIHYLHQDELETVINQCKWVICRSGYSTIMDLSAMGKKAIFVPTPGQTEQEYLAENLQKLNCAVVQKQSSIQLKEAFKKMESINELPKIQYEMNLLDEVTDNFLKRLNT